MTSNAEKTPQFVSLLTHHQARIHSYILSLVPNFHDAGDIMQETSKAMWMRFDEFEPGTDFLAWGATIARYRVLEYRKRRQRNKELQLPDETVEIIQQHMTNRQDRTREYMARLKKCFQRLSPPDKDLVLMRYYENLKVKDVAARLGKSLRNAYWNLERVQGLLLTCMKGLSTEE